MFELYPTTHISKIILTSFDFQMLVMQTPARKLVK
jgi:hypothetical protein